MLDGIPVMTDGHTRAVAAILAGLDKVPLVWDEDELSWDMYIRCVQECKARGIHSPADLTNRIISEPEYQKKWDAWCDEMQAEVIRSSIVIEENELTEELPDCQQYQSTLVEYEKLIPCKKVDQVI